VIFGLGGIGSRLAKLAKAFAMRVIGIKRDPSKGYEAADTVFATGEFKTVLPQADFTALTCPLTKETENVIDADALSRMKKVCLFDAARGRCVDEAALIKALRDTTIAGAGIDVTVEEPLPASSPLWDFPNVLITPHTAGETRRYEENVLNILSITSNDSGAEI
jgi:phosphoglycerate dehydrogenase-like enzyme